MMKMLKPEMAVLILAAGLPAPAGPAAWGQINRDLPELEGVGVTPKPDAQVPLDLDFTNERGETVRLGRYFESGKPVVLTLNYFECPMLCTLQLNGLVDALQRMAWVPGEQFEIVTVSFNPRETPMLARAKKQNYIQMYGKPEAARGWHFLTGRRESIEALTEAVGFGFKWNEQRREYMHSATAIVLTPEGKVSRYIGGVMYDPSTLKLSLVEAAEGRVGSALDQIALYCYVYDESAGRYTLAAINIMRIGGLLTVLVLGGYLVTYWVRSGRRTAKAVEDPKP